MMPVLAPSGYGKAARMLCQLSYAGILQRRISSTQQKENIRADQRICKSACRDRFPCGADTPTHPLLPLMPSMPTRAHDIILVVNRLPHNLQSLPPDGAASPAIRDHARAPRHLPPFHTDPSQYAHFFSTTMPIPSLHIVFAMIAMMPLDVHGYEKSVHGQCVTGKSRAPGTTDANHPCAPAGPAVVGLEPTCPTIRAHNRRCRDIARFHTIPTYLLHELDIYRYVADIRATPMTSQKTKKPPGGGCWLLRMLCQLSYAGILQRRISSTQQKENIRADQRICKPACRHRRIILMA